MCVLYHSSHKGHTFTDMFCKHLTWSVYTTLRLHYCKCKCISYFSFRIQQTMTAGTAVFGMAKHWKQIQTHTWTWCGIFCGPCLPSAALQSMFVDVGGNLCLYVPFDSSSFGILISLSGKLCKTSTF